MGNNRALNNEVKKLHLEAVVLFAINNIPDADPNTLKQLLELINAGGSFGTISHEQIITKMNQVAKYIPDACANSLLILIDLLEIQPPEHLVLTASRANLLRPGSRHGGATPFFLEKSAATVLEREEICASS